MVTKKILLIELKNNNLGDSIIADTCEYIIKSINQHVSISRIGLFPPKSIMKNFKKYLPFKAYNFLIEKTKHKYIQHILEFIKWHRFTKKNKPAYKYYYDAISASDIVIVAGGGLIKYSREDLWNPIYTITKICSENNIPIMFNAVGVEGYDKNNFRCQLLKRSLSNKCVSITTRDDFAKLKKYIPKNKQTSIVGDSALYTQETYNIRTNNSDIIGIGLIRGKIYTDYGFNFQEENIIDAYVNIIKELEKNNFKWQLFCNGGKSDYRMGENILQRLNLPISETYISPRPLEPRELVCNISKYKAIIAARLHACIVATSLNIPAIGLIWNDKLKLFGKLIGFENRFIEKEKFINPEYVLEQLKEAIQDQYDENKIKNLKSLTLENLTNFIKERKLPS